MKFLTSLCAFLPGVLLAIAPSTALERLKEGNQRYTRDDLIHPDRTSMRREEIKDKQKPFAAILSCSDSRVSPEILFDQGIGDLFIVRVAGNVVGPIELNSIEYSVKVLGSSLIVVLGHQSCGAVDAVFKGEAQGIPDIAKLIEPVLKRNSPKNLSIAIKDNVEAVVSTLQNHPLFKPLIENKQLKVVGGYYNLTDGHVDWLNK
jgi:carbonic anhydrase